MEKSLVTGCAGFIGSHLAEKLLEDGKEVIGIDCFTDYYSRSLKKNNISTSLKHPNFKFIEKNLLEMNKYPEVDYVFHLAAQPGVRGSWGENFKVYIKNNIEVTHKLLEFYKNKKIKKFVYSSSSSVYGDTEIPMKEDSYLRPLSPYGVSKLAAENLSYLYWKNHNVPTVSLRYFTVYGPRQRPDMAINRFINSIFNGEKITIYGNGKQTRDFTFVSDAVDANLLGSKSEKEGEVYNVGGGNHISIIKLIQKIEDFIGKEAKIVYLNKQKGDVKDTLAENKKIKDIGWKPNSDINNGLKKYIDWYMNKNIKS